MAKRFIDTELFEDSWFMDLSVDAKVLWIFFITKCNHAGILELNKKLCQFQTGINDIETVIKELSNRIVTVNEQYIFIPKFIEFQYPNFPQSSVRQQASAINILKKYRLFDENKQTVIKELDNSYEHGTDNDNVIIPPFDEFKSYALEKKSKVDIDALKLKYEAWKEAGWKDGNNKPIKNWKSKLLNTLPYIKESESRPKLKSWN